MNATANLTAISVVVSVPMVVATGDAVSVALTAVNAVVSIDTVATIVKPAPFLVGVV